MDHEKYASKDIGTKILKGLIDRLGCEVDALMNAIDNCHFGDGHHFESPIELTLCTALIMRIRITGISYMCCPQDVMEHFSDSKQTNILIVPQYKWKSYRIDLAWIDQCVDKMFFIECDGHDFHERTKEQAARDRSRDRECQENGIPIIRFTGSEIWADPVDCAEQVMRFAWSMVAQNNGSNLHSNVEENKPDK